MEDKSDQPTQWPIQHLGLVFVLIIAAYFMDVIDASIVTVALPTIRDEFAASLADSQWIVGAYGITLAGFLMLMGRAGDVYGQKRIFISGLILFTLASFFGGLSPSLLALILFRAAQGVGAAMTTVTAFAIFIRLFPEGERRNRALGVLIAVLSAGFAAGSVAGGVLTVTLGWRSVMYVNVPVGIVAALLCQRFLPSADERTETHLDVPGALTITAGIILLVYGLTDAASFGFASESTVISLILSAIVLAAFVLIEKRSKSPLVPLEFLRRGQMLTSNTLALVMTSIIGGIAFIITVYLQNVLGYSALYAGLGTLPGALIFFFVGGWGAARVMGRIGVRTTLLISTILVTAGVLLLLDISPTGNYFGIFPGMSVWALGASIGFPAVNIAAVSDTKLGEEGLASGVVNTSFRIGFPLGLAVLLSVAGAFDPPSSGGNAGVVAGFQYAILAGALLGVIAFALALRLKNVKLPDGGSEGLTPA